MSWSATRCWTSANGVRTTRSTHDSRIRPNRPTNQAPVTSVKRSIAFPSGPPGSGAEGLVATSIAGSAGIPFGESLLVIRPLLHHRWTRPPWPCFPSAPTPTPLAGEGGAQRKSGRRPRRNGWGAGRIRLQRRAA